MKHAAIRAAERIGCDNAEAITADLLIALADPDRWHEYVEPAVGLRDNSKVYRFRVAEGIFYCIARNGYPCTIITQEQLAGKSAASGRCGKDRAGCGARRLQRYEGDQDADDCKA